MLSVAIITHNEEENIKDALESVKWADEIVVVDSFSNDRTREICKEYTDKVFTFEWRFCGAEEQGRIFDNAAGLRGEAPVPALPLRR